MTIYWRERESAPGIAMPPSRCAQLKAEWNEIFARWADTATVEQLEEWSETFAPEHPEWFAEGAA